MRKFLSLIASFLVTALTALGNADPVLLMQQEQVRLNDRPPV